MKLYTIPLLVSILLAAAIPGFTSAKVDQHPLAPVDTFSPRATLQSFLSEVDKAFAAYRKSDFEAVRKHEKRSMRCLDFSETPPAHLERLTKESVWQLGEILDRVELPDLADIPDAATIAVKEIKQWRIPYTEIDIAQVESGPRTGEFLITPATVHRIDEFYTRIRDIPKRRSGASKFDAYQLYKAGVGASLLPSSLLQVLPEWSKELLFGQEFYKWFFLLLALGSGFLICLLAFRVRPKEKADLNTLFRIRQMILPLTVIGVALILDFIVGQGLRFTGVSIQVFEVCGRITVLLALVYLLNVLVAWLADMVIVVMQARSHSINSQLIRLSFRLLFWIAFIFVVAFMAEELGVPIAALVASLGVGGLAIALAAQSTLENLVAGLTIYGDRSVIIGEFCRVGNTSGTVEEIGLRSTRLRTLERTLVTIPNAEFVKQVQENYSRRDYILFETVLGLRYETTAGQLKFVLGKLRELFYAHPMVIKENLRVRFIGFGAYSLDIEIYAYLQTREKPTFLAIREDLLLRIINLVEEAGAGFAFPSQTAYLASDSAIDKEQVRSAEEQVRQWRESGTLPFPELDAEEQTRLRDSLDYPPVGSADARGIK